MTRCPLEELTEDVAEALRIADFWRRGIPPVAGGYLDQTDSIIEACEMIWREEAAWKARKGLFDVE